MRVSVEVDGYEVDRYAASQDTLQECANDLASDIGMRLADLGFSCKHGQATIIIGENGSNRATSEIGGGV